MEKYRQLLGLTPVEGENSEAEASGAGELIATEEADVIILDIKYVTIDGNTYLYLIDENENLYRAMVKNHEEMLLFNPGDQVHLTCSGMDIVTCSRVRE
jgi:hypothetical protein